MRPLLIAIALVLSGCVHSDPPKPGVAVSAPVVHPKPKKCKAVKPDRPKQLKHPLPVDSPKTLIDLLASKLEEWVSYGDKAERAFDACDIR